MKTTLHREVLIDAPKKAVWDTMLKSPTYEAWTSGFCEGSHFEGSWDQGAEIRFLDPDNNGMISVIEKNVQYEFVSIKHIGVIHGGVADIDSEEARAWAPAYENYRFSEADGKTKLEIDMDITSEHEQMMSDMWTRALQKLKDLCESGGRA